MLEGAIGLLGTENLRQELLVRGGMDQHAVYGATPRGAAKDDHLDALACLSVARRLATQQARPNPDPPLRDGHGLAVAIWV